MRRNRGIQRSLLPRGSNDSADVMTALGLIARCVPSRRAGSSGQAIRSAIRYHCGDCWPGHGNDFQSLQNVAPTAIFEANSRLAARRTSLQQPPAQARAAARFQSRKVEPDAPRSRHPPIGGTTQQRPRRRAFMIRSANFLTGVGIELSRLLGKRRFSIPCKAASDGESVSGDLGATIVWIDGVSGS